MSSHRSNLVFTVTSRVLEAENGWVASVQYQVGRQDAEVHDKTWTAETQSQAWRELRAFIEGLHDELASATNKLTGVPNGAA